MPSWFHQRRTRRMALFVFGGLVALVLLAWLALPLLLRSVAQDQLSDLLGRPVSLAAVRFNPLTLTLEVEGLAVGAAAAGAPPTLEVGKLVANADLRSIFRAAPVIEALRIESPRVRLVRLADGRYDIDDVLQRLQKRAEQSPPASAEPARFALYNLSLSDGLLEFDDRPMARVHKVQSVVLGVPFVSNLDDAAIAITVEPRFAFTLDGTTFDTGAKATPFARDRAGVLSLQTGEIDLARWLPYLPASVPLRPTRGRLSVDVNLKFSAPPGVSPHASISGQIRLKGLALADRAGLMLAELQSLDLALADVQPLHHIVRLGAIELEGLRVDVQRDVQGRLNWLQALAQSDKPAATPAAPAANRATAVAAADAPASARSGAPAGPASSAAVTTPAPTAWQLAAQRLTLRNTTLQWQDQAVQPAAKLALQLPQLQLDALAWPLPAAAAPIKFSAEARLGELAATDPSASLQLQGRLDAAGGHLDLTGERWALSLFAPYVAQALKPELDGQLALTARAEWLGAPGAQLPTVTLPTLTLENLRLAEGRKANAPALASLRKLALADVKLDLNQRSISLARLQLTQPALELRRGADQALNVQQWLVQPAAGAPGGSPSATSPTAKPAANPAAASAPAWRISLQDTRIDGGSLRWRDAAAGPEPVALDLSALKLAIKSLQWPASAKAPWRVQGSMQIAAPTADRPGDRAAAGKLEWNGQLGLEPVSWRGSARIERFPVHAVAAYLGDALPVAILRAEAGWSGDVQAALAPAGLSLDMKGDARVTDLRLHGKRAGESAADRIGDELLSWQSLALSGLKVGLQPGAKPRVEVGEAVLADFFAKLLVTEQGRLNLTDLAPPPAGEAAGAAADAAGSSAEGSGVVATAATAATAAPAPPASAPSSPAAASPIDLVVGGIKLQGGRVDFTDRFVRPNYSADLSALNGQIGAFRSGSAEMATLALTGRVAGTALLDVSGSLNPTANPLALDIRARATDLELAPLSPYAAKYAGYAIERGKLSMDVSYKIQPDGQLQAKNQVVLNQLTFGDRIESPTATRLPVLLAVSLLKDRNGVIDLNLPIGGSINDPQFSVGGLIIKIIVNLLTKALTAPFALLSGGDSADLSLIEFVPGTSRPVPSSQSVIDKVAKALEDRPALKMTVTGASDPQSERDAMQTAQLEARLATERRQELLRAGEPASAPVPPLSADDRARLLKRVYGDTKLPGKPRNLVGLAKDIPAAEMEALLKASFAVNTDTARELALQRGLAVRDALIAKGLPNERLFLAAPKLRASTDDDPHWTPRVQLSLGTQ